MTEKQYRVICDDINAYSIHKDNELIVYDLFKSDADRICEELNQIADENEQLKQQLKELQEFKDNYDKNMELMQNSEYVQDFLFGNL